MVFVFNVLGLYVCVLIMILLFMICERLASLEYIGKVSLAFLVDVFVSYGHLQILLFCALRSIVIYIVHLLILLYIAIYYYILLCIIATHYILSSTIIHRYTFLHSLFSFL